MFSFPQYEVIVGDDLGDPDFWNRRFSDLDLRLHGQEIIEKDWLAAIEEITTNGIKRVDEAITPLLGQLEQDAQLGALFVSSSNSTLVIGTGGLTVGVTGDNSRRFAPAATIALVTDEAPYAVMIGTTLGYNRETGSLLLDIDRAYLNGSAATRTGWIISATSRIDYLAEQVFRAAGGGIASTNVEGALREILTLTAPVGRSISAGTGLTGGGDFSDDRELALDTAYTDGRYAALGHGHPFASLSAKPTTVAGYGIGDAFTKTEVTNALAGKSATGHTHPFADVPGLQAALDAKLDDTQASAFGLSLLDDANNTAARTTLGLGSLAILSTVGTANVADAALTNVKLATVPTATLKGRATAGTGAVEDLTAAQVKAILAIAISDVSGLQAALDAKLDDTQVSNYALTLLDDADAPTARQTLGLGSLATKSTVATADLTDGVVTNAKQASVSTGIIKGRATAGAGAVEDLTAAQVKTLLGIALADVSGLTAALAAKQASLGYTAENVANKGVANGYAPLGADGKVSSAFLPADGSYKGTWNASTNSPALTSSTGTNGDFYLVGVAGTTALDGVSNWAVGDQVRYGGGKWQRVPNTNAVTSVAGKTGTITLTSADLTDATAIGRALVAAADAAAGRTALGLGALAVKATVGTADVDNAAITNAKQANVATGTLKGRSSAGAGSPEDLTVAQVKALLALDLADLTGTTAYGRSLVAAADVAAARTTLGLGALALKTTVATADHDNASVTNAKLANVGTGTFKGRSSAGTGAPEDLTAAQAKALLAVGIADVSGLSGALDAKLDDSQATATGLSVLGATDGAAARTAIGAQADLGFTPIQQGNANGQLPTRISFGWMGGGKINAFVGVSTDLGNIAFEGWALAKGGDTMTGRLILSGDPVEDMNPATRAWVERRPAKDSVRVAAVTALGVSSTAQTLTTDVNVTTVDDVVMRINDRVLSFVESNVRRNGIYVVTQLANANTPMILTRATDADTWEDLVSAIVGVDEGTTYINTQWFCTAIRGGTIGNSLVYWQLVSNPQTAALGAFAATGFMARTGTASFAGRTITVAAGSGLSITNGNGVGGNPAIALATATTSVQGAMSASDKSKLDSVDTGANNYTHPTSDGSRHVSATGTGSNNKVLKAGASAGAFGWDFVAWNEIVATPTTLAGYGIANAYTSGTVDGLLAGKQDSLGFTAENASRKGVANGYAGLDSGGKIPVAFLPATVITDTSVVASQAEMLGLTAQKGDLAVRTDLSKTFILSAEPATTLANWTELRTPSDAVSSVAGRTGAVTLSSFDISDSGGAGRSLMRKDTFEDVQSVLGLKALAYKITVALGDIDASAVTNANLADMPTNTFKGRTTPGTGAPEDLSLATVRAMIGLSTYGLTLVAAADAAAARATLGTDAVYISRRNRITNPGMRISQLSGTALQTLSGPSASQYVIDGWLGVLTGTSGSLSFQQVVSKSTAGQNTRLQVKVVTADAAVATSDFVSIQTRLEGLDLYDLAWGTSFGKTAMLRFGWKGPAGTYSVCLKSTASSRIFLSSFTVSAAEANNDVVRTIAIPATSGNWPSTEVLGATLDIVLMAGSATFGSAGWAPGSTLNALAAQSNLMATAGNTFELFDVGLYEGAVAPVFELPSYVDDLRQCSRYFTMGSAVVSGRNPSITVYGGSREPAYLTEPMRVVPTLTVTATPTGTVKGATRAPTPADIVSNALSNQAVAFWFAATVNTGTEDWAGLTFTANARL